MKRLVLSIILFSYSILAIAQNKEYYELTNDAELAIIREDYAIALNKYRKAFLISTEHKTIDIVNAIKCSCLLKKYDLSSLLQKLFQKGLTIENLRKDKLLKSQLKKIENKKQNRKTKIDSTYRKQIIALDINDQKLRKKSNCYVRFRDKIDSIDKENIENLLTLIETKGFPSEDISGVQNIGGYQGWEIVVLHYNQKRSIDKTLPDLFSKILFNALQQNKITPIKYANLIEVQNDKSHTNYQTTPLVILTKREFRISKKISKKEDEINKKRGEIQLCKLKDYVQKIIFQNNNKYNFYFGISNGYLDLSSQSKSIKNKLKEKTISVKDYTTNH